MHLKIALLAGDGIGPEVIKEAVKVSNVIAEKYNHTMEWTPALTGAAAIEAVGDPYPDETCLLYTSPSPRDATLSRMPSSA